ncbi:MAG: hypothetical protein OJF59_002962 [Cytophagales bacterium]|jgi:methionine synthase II (cobalamin-independent)|nr:hypothetical protein [Bacteroidota bacterium]MBS1979593.1 hypothetical protein [Bacteroidota bacterium]WHZ09206.1 MAG: hypothetical protein OJF59_002962 [Cytophagales bacterium]
MKIATVPVGSTPRPKYLIEAMGAHANGPILENELARVEGTLLAEKKF